MAQRPKGLLELLARSGAEGLGMASGMALPMYQMKQREAQDARDFKANQDYRQQTLRQDEDQFQRNLNALNYRSMLDTQMRAADRSADYMKDLNKPDYPASLEGLYNRLYMSGDPRAEAVWGKLQEKNTFQDRPVREPDPKKPPNIPDVYNTALGRAEDDRRKKVKDWESDPQNQIVSGNTITGYLPHNIPQVDPNQIYNQSVSSEIPNWRAVYGNQFFGSRADDSGRALVGLPVQQSSPAMGFGEIKTQTTMPPQQTESSRSAMIKNPKVTALGEDFLSGKINQATYDAWMNYYRQGGQ